MTPGKHLLDPLKDWLLSLHGEQPWLMACCLFALAWGVFAFIRSLIRIWSLTVDEIDAASEAGEC